MPSGVNVSVRLDKKALDHALREATGEVGQTLAGFSAFAREETQAVFAERAGGVWWRLESEITTTGSRGVQLRITARKNNPHRIEARRSPFLVFTLSDGSTFIGTSVNHPGSSPPAELVLQGIERAGRRLTFTRAVPRVTTVR